MGIYNYKAEHIGKQKFRAKEFEEDIKVIRNGSKGFSLSIKAYGHGPLQLSTDKEHKMFSTLEEFFKNRNKNKNENEIKDKNEISQILKSEGFSKLDDLNLLALIYDEKKKRCNIMIFNWEKAKKEVAKIKLEKRGKRRKYPVFRFYNSNNEYIFEVRYGGKDANALQRGLWTHTKDAEKYFYSLTGWINYSHNENLVELLRYALISSSDGHMKAVDVLKIDIENLKNKNYD